MVKPPKDRLDDKVTFELTRAQALIIFELLARETPEPTEHLTLIDSSELHALWALEGRLEKMLEEILSPGYSEILSIAREQLRFATSD